MHLFLANTNIGHYTNIGLSTATSTRGKGKTYPYLQYWTNLGKVFVGKGWITGETCGAREAEYPPLLAQSPPRPGVGLLTKQAGRAGHGAAATQPRTSDTLILPHNLYFAFILVQTKGRGFLKHS